jgi:MFS family permease
MSAVVAQAPAAQRSVTRQRLLAAVAIIPILATVYQTLVLTDVTADVIRKGIEADSYEMIWTTLAWGIAIVYGVFLAMLGMARFGQRLTLCAGLVFFTLGNILCGASVDVLTMSGAKAVEGIGKGMSILICRSLLYRQFDRALIVAIGTYGVIAYSTRHSTPLVTAYVNDLFSWRWIFWVNVPIALLAIPLVLRFIRPDRPPVPRPFHIDWFAVTLFCAWVACLLFAFGRYRKWGGSSSNAFVATTAACVILPIALIVWIGLGFSPDEHLRRLVRVRTYVLAMCVRALMLLNFSAVLAILSKYMTELRDYPRADAGWVLTPASLTMATTTLLTTYFHRRSLRHVWLAVGVVGSAGCVWWLSSIDNFTPKERIATIQAVWGLFLGLLPPVFLTDEVEGLDPKDALYGGALSLVCLVSTLLIVPTMTGTAISAWTDRALDSQRMNIRENRPAVEQATAKIVDYYRQRGMSGPAAKQSTSQVVGGFVTIESVASGFRDGLQFLSLTMLILGLSVTLLLWRAARGLRAPPGAGYT